MTIKASSIFSSGGKSEDKVVTEYTVLVGDTENLYFDLREHKDNKFSDPKVSLDLTDKDVDDVIASFSADNKKIKTLIYIGDSYTPEDLTKLLNAPGVFSHKALILTLAEISEREDTVFKTMRTNHGDALGHIGYKDYETKFRYANVFYCHVKNQFETPKDFILEAIAIVHQHFYGEGVKHSRNLALLANLQSVLEIFGDCELDLYNNSHETYDKHYS